MPKRNLIIGLVLFIFVAFLVVWIIWGNTALMLREYTVSSSKLPEAFSGFRVLQVSDLHNAQIGNDNSKLLTMIKNADPDIIVITGDLIDSWKTDLEVVVDFVGSAVQIAPCYYVTGNHEARIAEYDTLKENLIELGVTVLDDTAYTIQHKGSEISIIGINDPSFNAYYLIGDEEASVVNSLNSISIEKDKFQLLLSHRPEFFPVYAAYGIDLVFSGHAHGGQFRLPFLGGLYAPNQGFLPEYDSGIYQDGNTSMVVSRGIGNSLFPFRFNNRPEVIAIELKHQ